MPAETRGQEHQQHRVTAHSWNESLVPQRTLPGLLRHIQPKGPGEPHAAEVGHGTPAGPEGQEQSEETEGAPRHMERQRQQ